MKVREKESTSGKREGERRGENGCGKKKVC